MVMNKYIEQILEDIENSKSAADKRVNAFCDSYDKDEYHIVVDEDNTGGIKLSKLFDIDLIFFPERNLLDNEQISDMVQAIESLWEAYGVNPIFHENLPMEARYCQLRNYLNHKVYPEYGKVVDVELCDYNENDCPFSDWCSVASEQMEQHRKNISA